MRETTLTATEASDQSEALQWVEKVLREQRADLARMLEELESLRQTIGGRQKTSDLAAENSHLRARLAELEHQRSASADTPPPNHFQEIQDLRAECEQLRQLLSEKEAQLSSGRRPEGASRESIDLESFEAELNRYRQQLEADRRKLDFEMQQCRQRQEELDDATREMEMEMSRERAELARERARLERLRDEVRTGLEHLQRDAAMRDNLISVQRLREEMAQLGRR
jgi:chromosome segregation ATPase